MADIFFWLTKHFSKMLIHKWFSRENKKDFVIFSLTLYHCGHRFLIYHVKWKAETNSLINKYNHVSVFFPIRKQTLQLFSLMLHIVHAILSSICQIIMFWDCPYTEVLSNILPLYLIPCVQDNWSPTVNWLLLLPYLS